MKITLLVSTLLLLSDLFSQTNCSKEIYTHKNGKPFLVYEWDTIANLYCGMFQEYDSTGILRVEGCYIVLDSVPCKDCYEGSPGFGNTPTHWEKYDYAEPHFQINLKSGTWKYYHANGQLKETGAYLPIVHAEYGMSIDLDDPKNQGHPIHVGVDYQQLKSGAWNYFDEQGNNLRTEHYMNGALVFVTRRH